MPEALLNAPTFAASFTAGTENQDGSAGLDPAAARAAEAQWYSPAPGAAQNGYLAVDVEGGALGRHEAMRLASDGNFSAAWRAGKGDQIQARASGENSFAGSWDVFSSPGDNSSAELTVQGCTRCPPLRAALNKLRAESCPPRGANASECAAAGGGGVCAPANASFTGPASYPGQVRARELGSAAAAADFGSDCDSKDKTRCCSHCCNQPQPPPLP